MNWVHLSFFFTLSFLTSCIRAQQNYSANSILSCKNDDKTGPSPAFLYTCNGLYSTCQAFLIFKSRPPYDSVSTISTLTWSDPSELARLNNVTIVNIFPIDKEVIVPVNCSCSGQYYQANATFTIQAVTETYFIVANNTYQGLSTCDALERVNPYSEFRLYPGLQLQVPLRCACPTKKQASNGTKYLLTYSIMNGDNIPDIGKRFNASGKSILGANGFLKGNPNIFPFTTILVPQKTEPSSLYTIIQKQKQKPSSSPPPSSNVRKKKSKGKLYVGVAVVMGCSVMIFISMTTLWFYKKKGKGVSRSNGNGKTEEESQEDLHVEIASFEQVLRVFGFEELKEATESFSPKSKVKNSVYKGMLGGEILAIKKMSLDVSKEVNMLNKINHFNLIKLHGICRNHDCFYLVYEYMKNGSLRDWICKKRAKETDSWIKRIQIALDVANGLHYLHNFTKPAYVHKDIKSSNILLDSNLRAKISNFSHARTAMKDTNGNAPTTRVVGTRGYMAPEYFETGSITTKIDVYAFGVVMFELITGKGAVFIQGGKEVLLTAAIASVVRGENEETELSYFIDPILGENGGMEYAMQVIKLSLSCLMRDPAGRPSMSEVVSSLVKIQVGLDRS